MNEEENACPCCDGTGKYEEERCWECCGTGIDDEGIHECVYCDGNGKIQDACDYCAGHGTYEAYEEVQYGYRVKRLLERRYGTRKIEEIPTLANYWGAK